MHVDKVDAVAEMADILQIGTRNMQNYPLLEAVAKAGRPVMLKRHFGCSLRDWLGAAEYILHAGKPNVPSQKMAWLAKRSRRMALLPL
jgi:3-deoxy-7-phosphoheptulonate synthase